MKTQLIGGIVVCCEPRCQEVFGTLQDWEDHWEFAHSGLLDDYRHAEIVCAAHGDMRGC